MKEIMSFVSFLALFIAILALLRAYDLVPTWLVVVLLLPLPIAGAVMAVRMLMSFFRPVQLPMPIAATPKEES